MASRWLLLAILTGSYGAGAFGVLGISPLSPSLVAGVALTRLQVALIVPSIYLAGLLFSLPGGRLADRLGARPSLLGGLAVGAAGLAIGSLSPGFPTFLPALGKAIMDLFPMRERGIAMGIKQMGLTLRGIASALVLPRVAARLRWRAAIATCGLVVALPVALSDTFGAGSSSPARRGGGAVSRLALGAASDRWLADRRSAWLAVTGSTGAASFACFALWPVSAPLAAGALAFATGIGAYGWVGIFFVISAELGGARMAGLVSGMAFASIVVGLLVGPAAFGLLLVRWDSYAAPWTAFAALSAVAAAAALAISPALGRERR